MSATFDATARAYLLGDLPDERTTLFEESLLTDPDALDHVEDIEHDLVEDYVAGRLTAIERRRFERHYLASAVHRDRVAFARALGKLPGEPARPVRTWPRAVTLAAAATILLTVVAGWFLRQPAQQPDQPPASAPRVPEAPSTAPTPAPEPLRVAIVLAPVITRSGTATPRLVVPDGTALIDLHLQGSVARLARAAVEIRTVEDRPIWTGTAPTTGARPDTVTVTIPADRLGADDYILTLSDASAQPLARYFFRVARDR